MSCAYLLNFVQGNDFKAFEKEKERKQSLFVGVYVYVFY